MTTDERRTAFTQAFGELVTKYGLTFRAGIAYRKMGIRHELEPIIEVAEVPDWQPPPVEKESESDAVVS